MNKRKMKILLLASLLGLVAITIYSQGTVSEAERKRILDSYHATEGEILFYGKVVDQYENPIEGASVKVSVPVVNRWAPMTYAKKALQTDKNGVFEVSSKAYGVSNLVGQYLYVERITKEGYDGDWVRGTNGSFSFSPSNTKRFHADASHPVIYRLRKTGTPTFLLHESDLKLELQVAASGWTIGYDFVKCYPVRNMSNWVFSGEAVFPDIKFKAVFNTNDATWTVVLSPGNTNGGIIVSDQLLYEAPATGYQPEYVFIPAKDYRMPIKRPHIYLKSRDPAIYTRIDIQYINANKEFLLLRGESVTNPYGERNLERATDLPWAVAKQLTDEVKAAFRADKRPAPPDLPKLIQEAKAKGH